MPLEKCVPLRLPIANILYCICAHKWLPLDSTTRKLCSHAFASNVESCTIGKMDSLSLAFRARIVRIVHFMLIYYGFRPHYTHHTLIRWYAWHTRCRRCYPNRDIRRSTHRQSHRIHGMSLSTWHCGAIVRCSAWIDDWRQMQLIPHDIISFRLSGSSI